MKKSEVYKQIKNAVKVYNLEGDKLFMECEKEIKKVDNKINKLMDSLNLVELSLFVLAKYDLDNSNLNAEAKDIHKAIFARNAEKIEEVLLDNGIILV